MLSILAVVDPTTAAPLELARALFAAVMSGQWFLSAALGLMLIVLGLRQLPIPALKTDAGGVLLNLGTSLSLALATAALAGASFTWPAFWVALNMAATAAGVYTLLKKLALPLFLKIPLLLKIPFLAALFPPKADGLVLATDAARLAAAVTAKTPTPEDIANGKT